ncbi:MAG: polysaccharide deacetylase family protein [Candidatus Woesearchaeota archaeon]
MENITIVTFDVDGMWVKENSFGVETSEIDEDDKALVEGIPKMLDLLEKNDIKATLFVVGKNVEKFPELHNMIKEKGHEIANHSYSHPTHMDKLDYKSKETEIERVEKIVWDKLKIRMTGYRSPFNKFDSEILDILDKRNYTYDSSVLPFYYPGIFPISDLFLKRKPYHPGKDYRKKGNRKIWEVPISSVGPFSLNGTVLCNFGINYLMILSKIVFAQKRPLVLHFHTRDLVDVPSKAIFMRQLKRREKVINQTLLFLKKRSRFLTMQEYCKTLE